MRRPRPSIFSILILASTAILALITTTALAESKPLLIEGAAANATHIVFSHAGQLWSVPRIGGSATLLVNAGAEASMPTFSPDGTHLAYARNAGRNWDVYMMSFDVDTGGTVKTTTEPHRLTYHPKYDQPVGWTPDGKAVLFITGRDRDGLTRLYTIPVEGVLPTALPLPAGYEGAFSPDGTHLAYTPVSMVYSPNYRHYRGGRTSPLWLADLADSSVEVLVGNEYNHRYPMWVGETLYFTADPDGTYNLYAYDLASKATRQLTEHQTYGIESASAHAQTGGQPAIVYVQDGRLHEYDLTSGRSRTIEVEVNPDAQQRQTKTVDAAAYVTSADLRSSGELVLGVRGDVVTWNPDSGASTRLTTSSDVAEREPVAAPGGEAIAYFSDASGDYEIHVRGGDGSVRKIAIEEHPSFYRQLVFSPDGGRLAFTGKRLGLWIADIESETARQIDVSSYLAQELYDPDWSLDGRYLAYAKATPDHLRHIFIHDAKTGERHQVTHGIHAMKPVFDRNGKYLHYLASNDAGLVAANHIWGLLSATFHAPIATGSVHTVVLRRGTPAPFFPVIGQPNPEARIEEVLAASDIDFEGIQQRIVPLPIPQRDYVDLRAGGPGELYLGYQHWPETPGGRSNPAVHLYRARLAEAKSFEEIAQDVDSVTVSTDGGTLLYQTGDGLFLRSRDDAEGQQLDLSALKLEVDPGAEWRQMYREAWRLMRDYFYDPGHHGQNLAELERHYAAFLPQVTRRRDFTRLLRRMLGHVSISHMSMGGGDAPRPAGQPERTGLLGADFEIDRGHYRITRIYRSGPASSTNRLVTGAPLGQPGVDVREGDYLLAVGETAIDASKNLHAFFIGTAYNPVRLTVGPHPRDPSGTSPGMSKRTFTVVPVAGDNSIRRSNAYDVARRQVAELSAGRLAYIAVPDYGGGGVREFLRQFFAGASRGLVIDQRYGPGGITSDVLLRLLTDRPLHRYAFPYGEDLTVPTTQSEGPKVVLINEGDGSASETFPLMFKLAKAGTLVGKRTMGGGTGGALSYPRLIDGGRITIPNRAGYDPEDGTWLENRGVAPDVEVENWPSAWRAGRDPQLEKAVEIALRRLEEMEPSPVHKPAYPVHP